MACWNNASLASYTSYSDFVRVQHADKDMSCPENKNSSPEYC